MDASGRNASSRDRKIPARVWNNVVRATEAVRIGSFDQSSEVTAHERAPNVILVKNTTGAVIPRYGAVAFNGVQNNPTASSSAESSFANNPVLTGVTPSGEDTAWGVALDPIAYDAIGRVAVGGAVPAKVDISDSSHKFATTKANSTSGLKSAESGGATILWSDGSGDGKWALVRLGGGGGLALKVGKVVEEWSIDTCADVTIWSDGGVVCEPAEMWPTEVVEGVLNVSHNVRAGSWVVIGKTTQERWVLVDSGHSDSCQQTIGGEDITKWPGWNGSVVQLLGHDENGCLKWFDSEECEETSPGGP